MTTPPCTMPPTTGTTRWAPPCTSPGGPAGLLGHRSVVPCPLSLPSRRPAHLPPPPTARSAHPGSAPGWPLAPLAACGQGPTLAMQVCLGVGRGMIIRREEVQGLLPPHPCPCPCGTHGDAALRGVARTREDRCNQCRSRECSSAQSPREDPAPRGNRCLQV